MSRTHVRVPVAGDSGLWRVQPIHDLTSSGLTHSWSNLHLGRDSPVAAIPGLGALLRWVVPLASQRSNGLGDMVLVSSPACTFHAFSLFSLMRAPGSAVWPADN